MTRPHGRGLGFAVAVLIGAAALCLSLPALAQTVTFDLGGGGAGGTVTGRIIQIIALITVLSLAPSILVMVTSFTRIVVVLSFLRSALGVQQTPPNTVLISLALFLTVFVMAPTLEQSYRDGIAPLMANAISEEQAFERSVAPVHAFMMSHVREQDLRLFVDMIDGTSSTRGESQTQDQTPTAQPPQTTATGDQTPLRALIPAFMISELRRAFEIGFLLFLPFLVIDMVVASLLMSMGMMMLPPVMISLPFKLIFFVLVDGWYMVAGSLVRSYGG